jgi:zinc transporter ZupT
MDTFQLKIASIIAIAGSSVLGGILPLVRLNSPQFLSLGNCFGGGNFLAIALVHLFAEANEGFEKLGLEKYGYYYFIVGLLIPLFFEKVLIKQSGHHHSHHDLWKETLGKKSILSIYILLSLLAVHSFIEGTNHFSMLSNLRLINSTV